MYKKNLVFTAACAGMTFFGVTMLSLGPILGVNPDAGVLSPLLTIGIIIGTILFGPVVDRYGYKWLLIGSAILSLAGILGLAATQTLYAQSVSIVVLGVGGGILNGETNALVSDIYDDANRGPKLSLLGAFYCLGALLWTLCCTFFNYVPVLYTLAAVMAVFIIMFFFIEFPKAKPQTAENKMSATKIFSLLKYPALIMLALVLFFQSGFEGVSSDWTISFLKNNGIGSNYATFSMTVFSIAMLIGRFALGWLMSRMQNLKVFFIYMIIALIGSALMFIANSSAVAYVSMALIGFGVGATYPVILNYIGTAFRAMQGTAMSIAMFIALLGGVVFKAVAKNMFGSGNASVFPYMLVFAVVVMIIIAPTAINMSKKLIK